MRYSVLCLLFIVMFVASCREKAKTTTTAETQMEWTRKSWDFGNIAEGEQVSHTVYFKNTGETNLLIKNVDSGCGCTTVEYDKAPVPPGKEGKIEIAFNSAGRSGKQ